MSAHPAPAKWLRRFLFALSVAALAILAFTFGEAVFETAQAANPPCTVDVVADPNATCGMSIAAPGTVAVGEPFVLTISADPSPPELIAAFTAEVLFGSFPELDECDNTFDDDGDDIVNDGCPLVGGAPEVGRFCDNATDDEDNNPFANGTQHDGRINDGCPRVGAIAEFDQCLGNIDDDGDGFINDGCPPNAAPETGGQCNNDTDDDGIIPGFGDGFVNDGCPAVGDPEFNECANADNDDPGDDPFVNDGCPVVGVTEAGECDNPFDDDDDGAPNDGCPQFGASGEAGSFCDDAVDDDGDAVINDGCPQVGDTPESGGDCAGATDDDGDGRPNDGCPPASADMTWLQRASCEDEVQVARKDGGPLAECQSVDSVSLGGAVVAVLSEFAVPPLEPLNVTLGSTTPLVELDFVCNTPGSHTLTLTAEPDSPPGALYAGTAANALFLKTVLAQIDLNFDGVPEPHQVADTIVIDCVAPVGGLVVDLGPQQDGLPLEAAGSTGPSARLLAGVASVAALGGTAWYARRRARERSRG